MCYDVTGGFHIWKWEWFHLGEEAPEAAPVPNSYPTARAPLELRSFLTANLSNVHVSSSFPAPPLDTLPYVYAGSAFDAFAHQCLSTTAVVGLGPCRRASRRGSYSNGARVAEATSAPSLEEPAPPPTKRKAATTGAAKKKQKQTPSATATIPPAGPPAIDGSLTAPPAVLATADVPFSFEEFTRDFHAPPGSAPLTEAPSTAPSPPLAQHASGLASEVSTLRQQVETLTSLLSSMVDQRLHTAPSLPERLTASQLIQQPTTFHTEPNVSGELPPDVLRTLNLTRFESMPYKIKHGHNPQPSEMLAAHRLLHGLHLSSGKTITPTSFGSSLRDSEAVLFAITSATITAIFSGNIGSRGLSVLCYRELSPSERMRGSSSKSNLFDLSKIVAPTLPAPPTFDDLTKAMKALRRFARAHWFEHAQWLLARLSDFVDDVARSSSASPQRVMTPVNYVDRSLGRALSALELDDPSWWRKYCEHVRRIDARGNEWTQLLLDDLASTPPPPPPVHFRAPAPAPPPATPGQPRGTRYGPRPHDNHSGMPAHIRALIPKIKVGETTLEPCLCHYAGGRGCPGGRDKCDKSFRTHDWKDELPAELLAYIRRPWAYREQQ